MKHFLDFNPTEEEMMELLGRPMDDEQREFYERLQGTDGELFNIATLLAHRGQNKEALKYIDAIKDDVYREDMKRILLNEMNLPHGALW